MRSFAVSTLDEHSSIPVIVCCVAFMSCGTSIFQSPNNSLYMGSAPREALGFAGSLGSLARYAGMALGITVASNILYGQMSVAMGEAVTSLLQAVRMYSYSAFARCSTCSWLWPLWALRSPWCVW